ncbi:G-patch domain [Trinorchestia longiramus]|nr:G-patch domain [Trinorchestia longiramus]
MGVLAEPRVKGRHIRARWEALRRTNETLQTQISSEGSDNSMGLGMARKLMENLGWKDGQGLGASNQGQAEPVKLHQNIDSRGVGYTAKRGVEQEHHAAHFQRFESVLAALSAAHSKGEKDGGAIKPEGGSGSGSDGGVREIRPKRTRNNLHYHKFAKAKDVSQYSRHDLDCVIGAKAHTLYSNVLKDKQTESSDKFSVSKFSSTEYFNSLQETESSSSPGDDASRRPGFGPSNIYEKSTEETDDIVENYRETDDIIQKNFQERMASSYATCFVSSGSNLGSETNAEDVTREDHGSLDIEKHSKKKKKKSKKSADSNVSTSPYIAVQCDSKVEKLESELMTAENDDANVNLDVESAAFNKPEVVEQPHENNDLQVKDDEALLVSKNKKKKNRKGKNDSKCNNNIETVPIVSGKSQTEIDVSTSTQSNEQESKTVFSSGNSVNTCSISNCDTVENCAPWSKYAYLYATSFVKGDSLPGTMENSIEEPKSDAAVEETSKKNRKKKSKKKCEPTSIDEAGRNSVVSELGKNSAGASDAECSDAAEGVAKEDGDMDGLRSSKKKKKKKVYETECKLEKKVEISEESTALDVAVGTGVGIAILKKKKSKDSNLQSCGEVREQENENSDSKCSKNVCETDHWSSVASDKKKRKKKLQEDSSARKEHGSDEIAEGSCAADNGQSVPGESKRKKKNKKLRVSGCESGVDVEEVIVVKTLMSQENNFVGVDTAMTAGALETTPQETVQSQVSTLKKKKKKSSQSSSEVIGLDEPENCVPFEGDSGEKKKRSKKRKRQETETDEENKSSFMEVNPENKRKKKKRENSP